MIEFRRDRCAYWCTGDDDCERPAAAIVDDGMWLCHATCDNEQHAAAALEAHAEAVADAGHLWIPWADVTGGPRCDGVTWDRPVVA